MKDNYTILLIDDEWCCEDGFNTPEEFRKEFLIDEYNRSNPTKPIKLECCTGQNENGKNDWNIVDKFLKEHEKEIDIILLDVVFVEEGNEINQKGLEYEINICNFYPQLADKVIFFTGEDPDSLNIAKEKIYSKYNFYNQENLPKYKKKITSNNLLSEQDLQARLFQLLEIVKFPDGIWYASHQMNELCLRVAKVAKTDVSILITGESGVGKEPIANMIHKNSNRSEKPLLAVNCATLTANLLESELFGHEKGSFTGATSMRPGRFELANGGTLYLDELGEMPLEMQAKLLRVLQENTFERVGGTKTITTDVRVIAATNKNLEDLISQGKFRADLYFRLNVVPLYVPPLRTRRDDIVLLVDKMLGSFLIKYNKIGVTLDVDAKQLLLGYHYPGNVRQLENIIKRLCILSEAKKPITAIDVDEAIKSYFKEPVSYSISENYSEQKISPPSELTLEQLLSQIRAYNPNVEELEGAYCEIRNAVHELMLNSLITIYNKDISSKAEKTTIRKYFAPNSTAYLWKRLIQFGFATNGDENLEAKAHIEVLKEKDKYTKFLNEFANKSS